MVLPGLSRQRRLETKLTLLAHSFKGNGMGITIGGSSFTTNLSSPNRPIAATNLASAPRSQRLSAGSSDLILDQKQIVAKLIASAGGIINTRA